MGKKIGVDNGKKGKQKRRGNGEDKRDRNRRRGFLIPPRFTEPGYGAVLDCRLSDDDRLRWTAQCRHIDDATTLRPGRTCNALG